MSEENTNTRRDALLTAMHLLEIKGKDALAHLDHSAVAQEILKIADSVHAWLKAGDALANSAAPVEVAESAPAVAG